MIPNTHQSIDEIIRAASPAEKVLWQQVLLFIGERGSVRQLNYQGFSAGSEFLIYDANKYYLALELDIGGGLVFAVAQGSATLYDPANAISITYNNQFPHWDATAAAARLTHNLIQIKNVHFSRVLLASYTHIKFNGYRLTR